MEPQHDDRREKDTERNDADGRDNDGRDREKRSRLKRNVGETERMISGAGGGALAAYGIVRGITNRSWGGAALALLGGVLAYRGLTGHCPVYGRLGISTAGGPESRTDQLKLGEGITVRKCTTVNRTPEDIYHYWRNFSNLPQFMKHLESVEVTDDTHSHWVAKAPLGMAVEWDAEIVDDVPNERIAWRSLAGSEIDNVGDVRFTPVSNGGTRIDVEINYHAPFGKLGASVAKLFGEEPAVQVREDLRRFKQMMETREIPTTKGQTSGRPKNEVDQEEKTTGSFAWGARDTVDEASWESFPASDPPAW